MNEEPVKCLKCGSTQVHAEKRGWSLTTGFIGSGQVMLTCLKCGYQFKPGQTEPYRQFSSEFLVLVIIGLVILVLGIIYAISNSSID